MGRRKRRKEREEYGVEVRRARGELNRRETYYGKKEGLEMMKEVKEAEEYK